MEALIPDQVKSIHEIMNNETPRLPKPGLGSTASELEQSIHVCAFQKEKDLPPGASQVHEGPRVVVVGGGDSTPFPYPKDQKLRSCGNPLDSS